MDNSTDGKLQKKHPTIGLGCVAMNSEYSINMWGGVRDATRKYGANLIYFAGGHLGVADGYEMNQACVVYER